jgi:hypothetical protein
MNWIWEQILVILELCKLILQSELVLRFFSRYRKLEEGAESREKITECLHAIQTSFIYLLKHILIVELPLHSTK